MEGEDVCPVAVEGEGVSAGIDDGEEDLSVTFAVILGALLVILSGAMEGAGASGEVAGATDGSGVPGC